MDLRCQFRCVFATQYFQHDCVRNQLYIVRVFLQSSLQRDFCFRQSAEVHFGDSLPDDGDWRGGSGYGGEFFVDVESGLVLFTAL